MEEASQIPPLVEPLMLALGADIEVHPVMILGTWARRPGVRASGLEVRLESTTLLTGVKQVGS
jgi:hypothetical protein